MEKLNPGTTVYFCWYDFQHKKEYTLTGEVVDNSDYQDTQWADFVYVRFQPSCVSAPIHHHFLPERLSTDQSNVPHDDCYLMLQSSDMSAKVEPQQKPINNPWLQMTDFKNQHWDAEHNHIHVDALDEFYRLWRIAINWRMGQMIPRNLLQMKMEYPLTPDEAMQPLKHIVSDKQMDEIKEQLKKAVRTKKEPKKKCLTCPYWEFTKTIGSPEEPEWHCRDGFSPSPDCQEGAAYNDKCMEEHPEQRPSWWKPVQKPKKNPEVTQLDLFS